MLDPRQPIEVEMRDGQLATCAVAVADAEARAGHRVGDAQGTGGAAHERRLARAQLSAHQPHAPVPPAPGGLRPEGFRLRRIRGVDDAHGHDETVEPTLAIPLNATGPREKGS